jgi:serine/threonine protein phosphatase PrpC
MIIEFAAATNVGRVRRRNEDSFGYSGSMAMQGDGLTRRGATDRLPFLAAVADGLGGYPCGDVASRLVVSSLLEASPATPEQLLESLVSAHERLLAYAATSPECGRLSSTVAAVLALEETIVIANVGDTRCYVIEENGPMTQLSVDDVPLGEVGLPGLTRPGVTGAIGGFTSHRGLTPHLVEVSQGAVWRVLLCSDGLSSYAATTAISDAVRLSDLGAACESLMARTLDSGGRDNATALLLEIGRGDT